MPSKSDGWFRRHRILSVTLCVCGFALAISLVGSSCASANTATATNTVTFTEFGHRLDLVAKALRKAQSEVKYHSIPSGGGPVVASAKALPPILVVSTRNGPQVVNTVPISNQIRAASRAKTPGDIAAAYAQIADEITELRKSTEGGGAVNSAADSVPVRAKVNKILSARAYAPIEPANESAFMRWLRDLFSRRSHTNMPNVGGPLSFDIRPIVLIVLAGIVVYIILSVRISFVKGSRKKTDVHDTELLEEDLLSLRDSDGLLNAASEFARNRDYRTAYRFVYLALIVKLDEDQRIEFDRGKTNWEYYRYSISGMDTPSADLLLSATHGFDDYWYGFGIADHASYVRMLDLYKRILESVAVSLTEAAA